MCLNGSLIHVTMILLRLVLKLFIQTLNEIDQTRNSFREVKQEIRNVIMRARFKDEAAVTAAGAVVAVLAAD